jgi:hypothetical protein
MPKGLDSADRKLLIGAGILLIAVLIASAVISPQKTEGGQGFPSTYSAAWDGAKAAFLLLRDSGYNVERWENSPAEIPGDHANEVLILAEPVMPPSSEDRAAIREFLQGGGRILATGSSAAKLLPDAPSFTEGDELEEQKTFTPQMPSPLAADAPEIKMLAPQNWQPQASSQLVIYGNKDTAAVINYQSGRGEVIWWGANTPLTNGGIRDASNLTLFLNSVGPANGTRILWDEYFHGAHSSLWAYIRQTPLPWGMLQIGLVFLAIVLTFSRRLGPIRMPAKISRLSPLEFVETLGDLYATRHAGAAAVHIAHHRLRFLLTRQLGLAPDVPATDLARSASEALGWKQDLFLGILERAERAVRIVELSDDESLQLTQEIYDYTTRLEVRRTQPSERRTE